MANAERERGGRQTNEKLTHPRIKDTPAGQKRNEASYKKERQGAGQDTYDHSPLAFQK